MSRFQVGDQIRIWKPGYAEHGAYGVVTKVEDLLFPAYRGPHQYKCDTWCHQDGRPWFGGWMPDIMIVGEDNWQKVGFR